MVIPGVVEQKIIVQFLHKSRRACDGDSWKHLALSRRRYAAQYPNNYIFVISVLIPISYSSVVPIDQSSTLVIRPQFKLLRAPSTGSVDLCAVDTPYVILSGLGSRASCANACLHGTNSSDPDGQSTSTVRCLHANYRQLEQSCELFSANRSTSSFSWTTFIFRYFPPLG